MKAIIQGFSQEANATAVNVGFYSGMSCVENVRIALTLKDTYGTIDIIKAAKDAIVAYGAQKSYSVVDSDVMISSAGGGYTAWMSGAQKEGVKQYASTATVSNGKIIFYLTDDGTAQGNPVFANNVFLESLNVFYKDAANVYMSSVDSVSVDRKSLTLNIQKVGTVVLGIVQVVSPANGVSISMSIYGN